MRSYEGRKRRARNVAARAAKPRDDASGRTRCYVLGCRNLTSKASGKGLNRRLCRKHEDFHERHGSPYRASYGRQTVNPYRRVAFDWLAANPEKFWVKHAVGQVAGLYEQAGRMINANSLRGLKPSERAAVAWARLREAKVDPRLPVTAWLAIAMIIEDDPQAITTKEYRRVQAAKLVHRMASGTHRPEWRITYTNRQGKTRWGEFHAYPVSRGRVLRHIGEQLERAVEQLADHHLAEVRALLAQRRAAGKLREDQRPFPGGVVGGQTRRRKTPKPNPVPNPTLQPLGANGAADATQEAAVDETVYEIRPPLDPTRKRPYSIRLKNGMIVTYN